MSTRDEILGRIRAALATDRTQPQSPVSAEPVLRRAGIALADEDLIVRFIAKAQQVSATCVRVAGLADVPAAVDAYLRELGCDPRTLVVARALEHLAFASRRPAADAIDLRRDGLTSVTPAFAAIAETGSVVCLSSPDTPTSLNFVAAQHVVVVPRSAIVATMEDVWAKLREQAQPVPRAVNVITGPSRTADVEQTVQVGVHGPKRMHLIVCDAL